MSLSKPELITYAGIGAAVGLLLAIVLSKDKKEQPPKIRDRETKKVSKQFI